jgi:hypothetical protein
MNDGIIGTPSETREKAQPKIIETVISLDYFDDKVPTSLGFQMCKRVIKVFERDEQFVFLVITASGAAITKYEKQKEQHEEDPKLSKPVPPQANFSVVKLDQELETLIDDNLMIIGQINDLIFLAPCGKDGGLFGGLF